MKAIFLTDHEATLAAQNKLTAIVRVMKEQPPKGYKYDGIEDDLAKWHGHKLFSGDVSRLFYREVPFIPGSIVPAKETWYSTLFHYHYKADKRHKEGILLKWYSPITMPLSAVRHWYEIKSVKAMQCMDINPDKGQVIVFNRPGIPLDAWCWYVEIQEKEKP